jgi:porphobilinogen deaminase
MPAGAFGRINGKGTTIILTGMVASPDGVQYFQDTIEAEASDVTAAEVLGLTLSEKLRRDGAEVVLKKIEQERQSQGKEGE